VTLRLYDDDPYLVEFEADVLGRLIHEGHPALVLDRTAFYPEGGGQPWDRGLLGGVEVLAVTERGGQVLHVMAAPVDRDHVRGAVDPTRRRDHRQQHHGQHLLSRALLETAGARTESFHLGAEASTLDLDREITDTQLEAAETRTNEVIWEARPVRVRVVTRADAARLGVEPPDGVGECVRLIEAEGFDLQACGGTHPRSTAEVGVVAVVGRERHKGGVRIRFLCGHRVLAAVRTWTATLADLGSLLSTPPEGLFRGVEGLASRLSAALERADLLGERLVEAEARRLLATASGRPPVVVGVYPSWTPPDLRALA
jgi:alanyl-tRNA synthetase